VDGITDRPQLESLYREAQSALKRREYERASGLLRQILLIDENYKDASRLLAQTVRLRRRRWYNDPRLWGLVTGTLVIGLGFWLAPKISFPARFSPQIIITETPTVTPTPPITVTPTITFTPTITPIPLSWKRISVGQDIERDTVTGFITDPIDRDVIYASLKNAGVYKTIDGGLSWRPAHQGLQVTQAESLLIDPQNPRILYAGTLAGIYKTEDGAESWRRIGDGNSVLMDPQNSNHLYARDNSAIYESTDQGNIWTTKYSLNGDCPSQILGWAIHPVSGQILYAGGPEEPCPGVYQSKDGGSTWDLIINRMPSADILVIGSDGMGTFPLHIGHSGGIVFTTYDEGKNVSDFRFCVLPIAAAPGSTKYYCAGYYGGLRMRDYSEEVTLRNGLDTSQITAIYAEEGTDRILAGGSRLYKHLEDGIFISTDRGASWAKQNNGLGAARSEIKIDPIDSSKLYLATYFRGVYGGEACTLYQSSDSGNNWLRTKDYLDSWCGPAFDGANTMYIGRLIGVNPHYIRNVYSSDRSGIHYSMDAGITWQLSQGGMELSDARYFFRDEGQTVFAIGRAEQAYSTDVGRTWKSCGEKVTTSASDTRLAVDLQGSHLYLATPGNGVLISTDNCSSWQASNVGLSNLFVNTIAIDPNESTTVYAGTDGGAYISTDWGGTWDQINEGLLGATVVYSIVVDKDSNVYAATPYGVFKLAEK